MIRYKLNPDRINRILSLYNKGVKIVKIAEFEGISRSSVTNLVREYRVANRKRNFSQRLIDKVIAMNAQGCSDVFIAAKIGATRTEVNRLRSLKLKLPGYRTTPEDGPRCYKKRVETSGHLGQARWEADRFEAFLNGAPRGITQRQFDVLKVISKLGMANKSLVAEALNISPMNALKHLRFLRRAGRIAIVVKSTQHREAEYQLIKPLNLPEEDEDVQLAAEDDGLACVPELVEVGREGVDQGTCPNVSGEYGGRVESPRDEALA